MADETTPVAVAPAPTPEAAKPTAAKPAEKAKVVAPAYRDYPTIPALKIDSMVESNPYVSAATHNEALGFPGTLVDGWEQKAVAKMGELLGKYRSLRVYMDACVHCGACTDKCHYFIGTGDPKNMPVARQDLMRSVYRRYYTLPGKLFPKLVGARDMTKDVLDDWFRYYNQCSECRRCSVFCPYGIDTAEVTMAAKEIMDSVGHGHKYVNEIMGKVHKIGNNLGLPGPALENTLEGLEEDVLEETGAAVKYPLDVKGAEVLLVTPSADFFAEPHVDSLIGYGKVFHAAGISWTLSSKASEAGNFGMFIGNYDQMKKIAMRVREAALELGVKRIVVGECGHAWRVAYAFWNTLTGIGAGASDPFAIQLQKQLDPNYKQPSHICEVTWDLIQAGRLKFNKEANDHRIVTFHDSCNVARGSRMGNYAGGQFDIPRNIIRAVANHYVDMSPDTTHERTFCCGGGGGLLTDELLDLRVKGALPRMEALNRIVQDNGVNFMATICAICKAQFTKVLPYYGFKMSMVGGVHQLVSTAIVLDNEQ
jgi:Fe-S oxidoreductase